jgi:hypothetical protein
MSLARVSKDSRSGTIGDRSTDRSTSSATSMAAQLNWKPSWVGSGTRQRIRTPGVIRLVERRCSLATSLIGVLGFLMSCEL